MARPTPAKKPRRAATRLLAPLVRGGIETLARFRDLRALHGPLARVRPYTMLHEEDLIALALAVRDLRTRGIAGALVECGTWRGGSAFLMAMADSSRRVWMFDSFEGLPDLEADDRLLDGTWGPEHPLWFDNLAVDVSDVERWARCLGVRGRCEIVKGWFDATLPARRDDIGPIALLRLDGDLYDSTMTCFEQLWDQVVPGGLVVIDDYQHWGGCTKAVHEFLGRRGVDAPIRPFGRGFNVVLSKPDHGQAIG